MNKYRKATLDMDRLMDIDRFTYRFGLRFGEFKKQKNKIRPNKMQQMDGVQSAVPETGSFSCFSWLFQDLEDPKKTAFIGALVIQNLVIRSRKYP